ncbi:HAMP domain-containing methyl-accepting chemotaxis protein [Allorhizobium sp. BGMRC 0089]|uniref:methyl-accepting chemotaxis protein n=1 Tax=Allorhizobium sonneratiae TaxID=2934936 RepID=UPI0020340B45|nr:HAMP domain-containing methyl-accepting chemotaxis protein [Allorhizobium sonneratiae]MCM2291698.1 HAMP domain-containing methyl-accepting chemotaxis protein [Allorhizobium sonneratiae]
MAIKANSIGFRAATGMTLLVASVLVVAGVGLRGIDTLTGAVSQTVDVSRVLIGANKAEGAIIQYLIAKDTTQIDAAVNALASAQSTLNTLSLGASEKEQVTSGITNMSAAVRSLASSYSAVQSAGSDVQKATASLLTLSDKAEKMATDMVSQAENNSNYALISLNRIRELTQGASQFSDGIHEMEMTILQAGGKPEAVSQSRMKDAMKLASSGMEVIQRLGGTPDVQPTAAKISADYNALQTALKQEAGSGATGLMDSLPLFQSLTQSSRQLGAVLRKSAEAELATKEKTDNERSKARIILGASRNVSNILKDALVNVERYRLEPSDKTADVVTTGLKKATGFGKMLTRLTEIDLSDGLQKLNASFDVLKTNVATFDKQASLAVSTSTDVTESIVKIAGETASKASSQGSQGSSWMWGAGGISLVLAIGIALFVIRAVARPMLQIAQAMTRLARGETDEDVTLQERKNEIGDMVRALRVFRETGKAKMQAEAAAERERKLAESQRLEREEERAQEAEAMEQAFGEITKGLNALAEGDLTIRLRPVAAKYEPIRQGFNTSVGHLEEALSSVVSSSNMIRHGLREIVQAASDLSRRTEQQAASLEETVGSLSVVSHGVDQTASQAETALNKARDAHGKAEKGGAVVSTAIDAMKKIAESASRIDKIIVLIDEISFQTNLLALNAGVEAARAGEAGKGFTVVAQEVRDLAQRSAAAAQDIRGLISASRQQVNLGSELVQATGSAFQDILTEIAAMSDLVRNIAEDNRQQSLSLREVSGAANSMDQFTQQNAAMAEEATAACNSLEQETENLDQVVSHFITSQTGNAQSHRRQTWAAA